MARRNVANKVIDAETRSELWFMAPERLSDSQVLLLLQIYLRLGRKFPGAGEVCKVHTRELGFVRPEWDSRLLDSEDSTRPPRKRLEIAENTQ
jgi:hypothetical protein